jgi:WD40 repeat protein/class 3 adenylate cyclase/type II secretory pathway predicted ATPase ExeA
VIRQGLSIDPDRRHPSPGAFAAALADAVGAAPTARIAAEAQIRTFLIADVRGYTSFTRDRGDEAAARLAAAFAEVAREGVESRDGEVIELRGDEALAVFGSARQALRAAVELQVVFQDESSLDPSLPLAVGIGLDAGEAVPVEGGFRGAALNLAARLCASAGPGEVLVSQGLVHLASTVEGVRLEERVPLDLKGLDAPVPVWQATHEDVLSGPIGTPSEHRGGARTGKPQVLLDVPPELDPLTRLVGRDRDARWIRWAWRQARRGPGRIVVVTGSAGAGKTLLAAEAAQLAAREGGSVAYASSRRSPADVEKAIAAAAGSAGPTLLVLDDLEAAGDAELAPIAELVDRLHERRLLVVGILRDGAASRTRAALERLAGGGEDRIRRLGPFDRDGVRAVAALYVEEPSSEVPVDTILQATGGAPPDVHRMAVKWAEGEAARRLGGAADLAARERMGLRTAEAEVVSTVIGLQRVRERGELLTGPEERPVADEPPFKGLASFDVPDARYFFGRERLIAEMVARLAGSSFLAVVGPSGSGKSSAVRAGLLPTLAAGALPGSESWIRVMLRPGEHPERELDRVVFAALPERLRSSLGSSQTSLEVARSLVDEERGHLLVVVDQAEELFTVCHDDAERQRFLDSLTSTVRASGVTVLLAIRADFYGRCSAHPTLAELVADNHVLVGPMTEEEYRRAIELPARLAGLRIDRPLVDALVGEVVDEPGGLPLLSTALLELWQRRRGRAIRLESYSETGGVRGAVAGLAEQAYAELTVEQQAVAKGVLLRLSTGEGEVVTRRRVPILEFDPGTNPEVGAVLDTLIEARLLIADDGTVEVAHEALLREWPRLEAWLEEDRAGRRLREHLTDQAKEWERSGREAGDLYRGLRLASALEWTADHAKDLNNLERQFLSESRVASERETERQRRTNRRLRGLLVGLAVFLVIALVAGGLALVQRGHARVEARRAERVARIATARELASAALANLEVDPELSILLATEAVQTTRSVDGTVRREAEEALHRAVVESRLELEVPRLGGLLAWSPKGVFVTEGRENSGLIDIRDSKTGERVLSFHGHDGDVNDVAFSPDGSRLASTGSDGKLNVWEASTGKLISSRSAFGEAWGPSFSADGSLVSAAWSSDDSLVQILDLSTDRVVSIPVEREMVDTALSPDGKHVAMATRWEGDEVGAVFDVSTGEEEFALAGPSCCYHPGFRGVSWSPDGRLIAASSGDTARVWDAETETVRHTMTGHTGLVHSVAWSPDPSRPRLVTGGSDGTAKVWEIRPDGVRELWSLSAQESKSGIVGVAFSPDGSRVMAGDADISAVKVWDLGPTGDAEWANLPALGFPGAEFMLDGGRVVTGSREGRVEIFGEDAPSAVTIWDLQTGRDPRTIGPPSDYFRFGSFDVSPDGSSIALGGGSKRGDVGGASAVRAWDASTGEELWRIADDREVNEVAFSPDGEYLATASWDGTAKIVDRSGRVIRVLGTSQETPPLSDVAFSFDAHLVATAEFNGSEHRVRVWEWARGEVVLTIDAEGPWPQVDFDPNRPRVVLSGSDGLAEVWDVESGARVAVLAGPPGGVKDLAFSPAGSRIAIAGVDGLVRLFDAETGIQQLSLRGSGCEIEGVSFSPDGTKLASTSWCDGVRIWALDIDDLLEIARREARRSLTDEECFQYLHVEACPASI